jgi:hypothetical protein
MKKIIFTFLFFNFNFLITTAQPQFQKTIGGTNHDCAYSIIQTTDGGFALAGYTYSFAAGYQDMYIVKLSSTGAIQWTRTVGGTGNDLALSIIQTTDGGYATVGYTNSFGTGGYDFFIVKLDANGVLQWCRIIDRASDDSGWSIIQTADGGFVIAGLSATGGVFTSDVFIVKLNMNGTFQWSKTYGGSEDEVVFSIIQTSDGSLIAAGYTDSFGLGGNNFYILKLDTTGTLQWSRTVGGTGPNGQAYSIIQTTDGGFAIAGVTEAFGAGSYDMHIVKLSSSGTLQWTRTAGGSSEDCAYSIVQTPDGGYIATGYTTSFGVSDCYTVKLNSSGVPQWSKIYGGSGTEVSRSIIKATGGGFVIAGESNSFGAGGDDFYIVKIDSLGNTCGYTSLPSTISGTGGTLGTPNTTVSSASPTIISPSPVIGSGGILLTLCVTGIEPLSNWIPLSCELYQNFPNPFNPLSKIRFDISKKGNVKIRVYDIAGQEIETLINQQLLAGTYEVPFDGSNFASGVYFYKLETAEFTQTRKMVLLK